MTFNTWRYRCPRGHASWRAQGGRYYCQQCRRNYDETGFFPHLVDLKHDTPEVNVHA